MIHPTAKIDSSAEIDEGASIGPFTVIGPNVKIHSGTVIEGNVFIHKNTLIGKNNLIFPFASIGGDPQDLKYLSLIHISEPTRRTPISYAVFCLKKKN